jgi:membrane-associated protease RseP (regulator of RpoE activity)
VRALALFAAAIAAVVISLFALRATRPPGAGAARGEIASLRAQLEEERRARESLEARVAALEAALGERGREAAGAADASALGARPAPAVAPSPEPAGGRGAAARGPGTPWFDEGRLLAAGLSEREASDLRRLYEEVALERLYVRDQAAREGWARERVAEANAALDQRLAAVRDDYGEEAYDWMLYAADQSNRVAVQAVLGDSPAASAGIEAGDVLLRYDGERVFSASELVRATMAGRQGESVDVEVMRGGELRRTTVPRGPLGVTLAPKRVAPEPVR